jgi:UPF0716 family protein affecting phage T7 exclusion
MRGSIIGLAMTLVIVIASPLFGIGWMNPLTIKSSQKPRR